MINGLRNEIEKTIAWGQLDTGVGGDLDNLHTCFVRVEHQADTSDKETPTALVRDQERLAVDGCVAFPEIIESRHA